MDFKNLRPLTWFFIWFCITQADKVCYKRYGCFSDDPPFDDIYMSLPQTPEEIKTDFYLYTPLNDLPFGERFTAEHVEAVRNTSFDPKLRLTVIVHGFTQDGFKPWITKIRKELMKKENMNIIVVNWEIGASFLTSYDIAAGNARLVGAQLAELIMELYNRFSYKSNNVHVVGHSLGAHVAGFAGTLLGMRSMRLRRITGLDPARPGFDNESPAVRLDPSDAEFVDVIHTDAHPKFLERSLGLERISGHVDFYPNGGASQPGCIYIRNLAEVLNEIQNLQDQKVSLPWVFACDHKKVIDYFTSSINHQCSRKAFPCESWEAFKQGRCIECEGACPEMGYNADQYHVNGSHKFYLATYDDEGHCAPKHYVSIVLSGLKSGFGLLNSMVSKKIIIKLIGQDDGMIQTKSSLMEYTSQISRLVFSERHPGSFKSIVLSYHGRYVYIGKATVRHENNTFRMLRTVEGFSLFSQSETDFYLFTPRGTNDGERISANSLHSIRTTTFDPNLRLAVIVHGYWQNRFIPWIGEMRRELMKREEMNVIVVDWEARASMEYLDAARNTRVVGRQLANFVKELHYQFRFNSTKVHVIGHGLGAHVAGFAGAFLRMRNHTRLGRITGLDPAQVHFDVDSPHKRLDPSDAEFVDVIHTDAGYYLKGGLGLGRISGHVDYYPNGGTSQPGCPSIKQLADAFKQLQKFKEGPSAMPWVFACDHMKVISYFTSSINHRCSRKAFPCESWEAFKQGRCFECEGACPEMGYNADQYHVNGSHKFYLSIYDKKGYCAPRHYVSVVLSGLRIEKLGFWFFDSLVNAVKSKKIGISLISHDGKTIQTPLSEIEDASQISRLVPSDHHPKSLKAIVLTYSGSQDIYIDKATVRDENNTYTACFNKWISSGFFSSGTRHRVSLRRGDHDC
ncbi:uncharacterized protein LOC116295201 [Actinia tenebrosa]|uniref:Uncharacterized protein LOC116295201 n=1 Tax=Actinia tenebrosa TaxID=6105 RepID=A0A6P8I1P6_ACTTE|nr:uncharacterized protein LOC116295201 [Actinia tenebrosa]